MNEGRLTPDEVVAAYRRTGLRPCTNFLRDLDDPGRACGLGAVWKDRDPVAWSQSAVFTQAAAALGLDLNYVRGFARGFDRCGEGMRLGGTDHASFDAGESDGIAAHLAVEEQIGSFDPAYDLEDGSP